MKYDIFISYRREGGKNYARTLKPELEKRGFKVFLDFDELKDGVFDKRIMDAISESPIFLVILSQGALDRCINEEDWVRQEILFANESKRHIVPVEVDKTFRGFPSNIPHEIKKVLGQHQFSQIDTETLLQESIDKLVKDRITPHIHHEEEETGVEIHIETDADCKLFRFKSFIKELKAGEDNIVLLKPGKHKLDFISTMFSEVKESMTYSLASDITCDFIEVNLKEKNEKEKSLRVKLITYLAPEHKKYSLKGSLHYIPFLGTNGLYGYRNWKDQIEINCQWQMAEHFHEGYAAVKDENGKWGYIDKEGQIVIPFKWKEAHSFVNGLAIVKDENEKWGYIDKEGQVVIPIKWERAYIFKYGYALVEDEHLNCFLINKDGEVIYKVNYNDSCPCGSDKLFKDCHGDGFLEDSDFCRLKERLRKGTRKRLAKNLEQDSGIHNIKGEKLVQKELPESKDGNDKVNDEQSDSSQLTTPIIKDKLPGRYDPCPCGSGKRFMNCHGKGIV